jgi:hypothetical protein
VRELCELTERSEQALWVTLWVKTNAAILWLGLEWRARASHLSEPMAGAGRRQEDLVRQLPIPSERLERHRAWIRGGGIWWT